MKIFVEEREKSTESNNELKLIRSVQKITFKYIAREFGELATEN